MNDEANNRSNHLCGLEETVMIPLPSNVFLHRGNVFGDTVFMERVLCGSTSTDTSRTKLLWKCNVNKINPTKRDYCWEESQYLCYFGLIRSTLISSLYNSLVHSNPGKLWVLRGIVAASTIDIWQTNSRSSRLSLGEKKTMLLSPFHLLSLFVERPIEHELGL